MLPSFKIVIGTIVLCGLLFAMTGAGFVMPETHTRVGEMPAVGRPMMQDMITDEPAQPDFRTAQMTRRAGELDELRVRVALEIAAAPAPLQDAPAASAAPVPVQDALPASAAPAAPAADKDTPVAVEPAAGAQPDVVTQPAFATEPVVATLPTVVSQPAVGTRPPVITQPAVDGHPDPDRTATPVVTDVVTRPGGATAADTENLRPDGSLGAALPADARGAAVAPAAGSKAAEPAVAVAPPGPVVEPKTAKVRLSPAKPVVRAAAPPRVAPRVRSYTRAPSTEPNSVQYDRYGQYGQFNQFNQFNQTNNYKSQ